MKFGELPPLGVNTLRCWEAGGPREGEDAPPLSIYLALCISSIWRFPSYTLYDKQVIVSKMLP